MNRTHKGAQRTIFSVFLCYSVREKTLETRLGSSFSHCEYFFLSQSAQSSLSLLAHSFEPTERLRHTENTEASPPTPLRMERGVVCEVTPLGLLAYFAEFFLSQSAQS